MQQCFLRATQGEILEEAIEMAQDYIGTYLYDDFSNILQEALKRELGID